MDICLPFLIFDCQGAVPAPYSRPFMVTARVERWLEQDHGFPMQLFPGNLGDGAALERERRDGSFVRWPDQEPKPLETKLLVLLRCRSMSSKLLVGKSLRLEGRESGVLNHLGLF